jgi:hypothetical protein
MPGIGVRQPGVWRRRDPAKPANEVTTDSESPKPANEVTIDPDFPKPTSGVTTDSDPRERRSISACEPYREIIEQALDLGRNAIASGRAWFASTRCVKEYCLLKR